MKKIIQEIKKIRTIMGDLSESLDEKHIQSIRNILSFNDMMSSTLDELLNQIIELSSEQIIDFDLLERGLKKVLLKKGNKRKNVGEYFEKVLNSLKNREKGIYQIEPESDEFDLDFDEPSILPKKVFKKDIRYTDS